MWQRAARQTGIASCSCRNPRLGRTLAALRKDPAEDMDLPASPRRPFREARSSIYRNRPEFSVFGVGDYSFASWKVAISGFYKNLRFTVVGPISGKAVVFDYTSYFLPWSSEEQADYLTILLNSRESQAFYSTFIFWDSKRPITAELLGRLGLRRLARESGSEERFAAYFGGQQIINKDGRGRRRKGSKDQLVLWSESDRGFSRAFTSSRPPQRRMDPLHRRAFAADRPGVVGPRVGQARGR